MAHAQPDLPAAVFEALVAQARGGSTIALGRLMAPLWPWLEQRAAGYISRRLRAKSDAADLVQETMLEAQRAFTRFAGNTPEALRGWLSSILRRRGCRLRRRYAGGGKRDPAAEVRLDALQPGDPLLEALADPAAAPGDVLMAAEVRAALEEALARLPAEAEAVVRGWYFDGLRYKEIGLHLGCSEAAAHKRRTRAVASLRKAGVRGASAGVRPARRRTRPSGRLPKAAAPVGWRADAFWARAIPGLTPWDPAGSGPAPVRAAPWTVEYVPSPGMAGAGEVVTLAAEGPYPAPWGTASAEWRYHEELRWAGPGLWPAHRRRTRPADEALVAGGPRPAEKAWHLAADSLRPVEDDRPLPVGRPDYAVCGPVPGRSTSSAVGTCRMAGKARSADAADVVTGRGLCCHERRPARI